MFYDVEVFPNLFLINLKEQGEGKPVVRMIARQEKEKRRTGDEMYRYHLEYKRWLKRRPSIIHFVKYIRWRKEEPR